MVQSVSTSGSIAAALMAAAQEREEMRRRIEAEQAAANARLRPEEPDDNDTDEDVDELVDPPRRNRNNAASPPKRGPTQRELRDRQYGPGGIEEERKRQKKARDEAAQYNERIKARIRKRNEENTFTSRMPFGRSYELGLDLDDIRAEGGQAAVDDFLRKQFPEFAEQQDSGMKMNPSQAERKADRRRENNRRANNTRDFRETFGQDRSSLQNRFGSNTTRLMRDRMRLAESRTPSYDMGEVMPEGFHRLDPDVQRLRVRRGQEKGMVTDADMVSLLDGGDVSEITDKPRTGMAAGLATEAPVERAIRLGELGRAAEMERVYDAGGTMGNANQQGFGRPEDAATRRGTLLRPNVLGAAAQGLGDYFQDPIGTTADFYDRNVYSPARDFFGDILDRLLPR